MPGIIEGYNYDIFISYRQKDNKYDGWVTEFVDNLKKELEATFKEEISVYFDINPHDGLLETHDVDESLKLKLKCLIFIPIISRTYCDPKSFAWEQEFKAFVKQASQDKFGLKVKLPNGNVASRVLPIYIYDLDIADIKLCESVLGGALRGVEFIYKSPGVNRPLRAKEDHPQDNLNRTYYRDQINKMANAINEIISCFIPDSGVEVDMPEPQKIEPQVVKLSESDLKASKSKYKYPAEYFSRSFHSIKRLIIPFLSLIVLSLIIIITVLLRSEKTKYETNSIYSNIPVEYSLMDPYGQYPFFAISPDSKIIAYVGDKGIQLNYLSNFSTTLLPGTTGRGPVVFSPDGQFIAFIKEGQIYRIGVNGSPMIAICQTGNSVPGFFWGNDDRIYFPLGFGSEGIWRVSANGGEPEKITSIIDSLGENAHTWPQLLPDSRTLLFTSLGPSGGSADSKIILQKTDTKERQVMIENAIFGRYLSNGNILFANNEGNIFILPFNLRKLKIKGEPKAILSGVNTSTWSGVAFLSISETGNLIFLPRITSPLYNLEVVDRLGRTIAEDSIPMKIYESIGHGWSTLNISLDCNFIAVTGRTYGNTDIWLLNLKSKTSEKITFESAEDEYPVFSPDGKSIAYTSAIAGTERKILIQDLEKRGNPRLLRKWPRHIHLSDWSPDGKWLAAHDYSSNNSTDCYAISVNSGDVIPVSTTQAEESGCLFSPDGKWISYRSFQSGKSEIYLVSFPEIENKRQLITGCEREYRWDRTGRFIYYRNGDNLYEHEIEIGGESGKTKSLKLFQTQFIEFDVSHDGQKFYLRKTNLQRPDPPLCLIMNWFQEFETKKSD